MFLEMLEESNTKTRCAACLVLRLLKVSVAAEMCTSLKLTSDSIRVPSFVISIAGSQYQRIAAKCQLLFCYHIFYCLCIFICE